MKWKPGSKKNREAFTFSSLSNNKIKNIFLKGCFAKCTFLELLEFIPLPWSVEVASFSYSGPRDGDNAWSHLLKPPSLLLGLVGALMVLMNWWWQWSHSFSDVVPTLPYSSHIGWGQLGQGAVEPWLQKWDHCHHQIYHQSANQYLLLCSQISHWITLKQTVQQILQCSGQQMVIWDYQHGEELGCLYVWCSTFTITVECVPKFIKYVSQPPSQGSPGWQTRSDKTIKMYFFKKNSSTEIE